MFFRRHSRLSFLGLSRAELRRLIDMHAEEWGEERARLTAENEKLREQIREWVIFANGALRREAEARDLVGVAYPLMRPEEMR
jgi:hypothetical protein